MAASSGCFVSGQAWEMQTTPHTGFEILLTFRILHSQFFAAREKTKEYSIKLSARLCKMWLIYLEYKPTTGASKNT